MSLSTEIITEQEVYYNFNVKPNIEDVVDSLLGLEQIISSIPKVFENIHPGLRIPEIQVVIDEIRSGSLHEKLLTKLIFKDEQQQDAFIESIRQRLGLNDPKKLKIIIAVLISALMSGSLVQSCIKKSKDGSSNSILSHNQVVLGFGSQILNVSKDQLESAITEVISKDRDSIRNTLRFIKPARRVENGEIVFNNNQETKISKEIIYEAPEIFTDEDVEDGQKITVHKNVEIQIRAIDFDSKTKGWAAIVPSISERRVKLQVDDSVAEFIAEANFVFRGDLICVSRLDDRRIFIPRQYVLTKYGNKITDHAKQTNIFDK